MAELVDMDLPSARRREIALAMVEALRVNAREGAPSQLSPPGAAALVELFDGQAGEVAQLRDENSRLVDKVVAAEERQLSPEELEDRAAEADTDQRTISCLQKDLEEERTWSNRLRAQLEEARAFVPQTRDEANSLREQVAQLEEQVHSLRQACLNHIEENARLKVERDALSERAKFMEESREGILGERNNAYAQIRRLADDYAALKASAKDTLERVNGRAFQAEGELVETQQRLQLARNELAAALNDRDLMARRLADMGERYADLQEVLLREVDEAPLGVVVIELGERIR